MSQTEENGRLNPRGLSGQGPEWWGAAYHPPHEEANFAFDGFFSVVSAHSLFLRMLPNTADALRTLEHLILLEPDKLRFHAQRLIILCRQGKSDPIFSALVDLFLSLGERGLIFKRYFIQYCATFLSPAQIAFFEQHGAQPLDLESPLLQNLERCLLLPLAQQAWSDMPLVRAHESIKEAPHTPELVSDDEYTSKFLAEIDEMITHGQLDLALDALEDSVLLNPDQDEIVRVLLHLYQVVQASARKEIMAEQLKLNSGRVPKAWDEDEEET
jgi:hypothetical protein